MTDGRSDNLLSSPLTFPQRLAPTESESKVKRPFSPRTTRVSPRDLSTDGLWLYFPVETLSPTGRGGDLLKIESYWIGLRRQPGTVRLCPIVSGVCRSRDYRCTGSLVVDVVDRSKKSK